MGISLDIYRQRIGCFSNKCYNMKRNSSLDNRQIKKGRKLFPFSFIKLVLLFSLCYQGQSYSSQEYLSSSSTSFRRSTEWGPNLSNNYPKDVNFNARYKFGNKQKGGIKIMHWNAGGGYLKNKIHEIENVISGYQPHLFGISESSFKKGQDISDVQIQDYQVYFAKTLENPNLEVSRLAVYVHKDIVKHKLRLDLMSDDFSSIWLEIHLPKQKRILVGNAYREWQYLGQVDNSSLKIEAQLERFTRFIENWETALNSSLECHLLGDLNINFLEYSKPNIPTNSQSYKLRSLTQLLFDRILPLGAVQRVSVATRTWPNQEPSGLDHYFTSNPRKLSEVQVIQQGSSDHKIIFAKRFSRCIVRKPRIIKKRSYKDFDTVKFLQAVKQISWWKIYSCNDIDLAVQMLSEEISNILDVMAPIRVFQIRTNYAPWLSCTTKELMKKRDFAQKKAGETNSIDDWNEFKGLRNRINNILKTEKRTWQTEKLKEASGDINKTWSKVKSWLGWSSGGPPTQLFENGLLLNKPSSLAKCMNEFFINKVRNLRENLPPSPFNPLELLKKLMKNRTCSFSLQPVHPDEILKIIKQLKSTKSCGLDNIDSFVIKLAKEELIPAITHIVNFSISQETFPVAWK